MTAFVSYLVSCLSVRAIIYRNGVQVRLLFVRPHRDRKGLGFLTCCPVQSVPLVLSFWRLCLEQTETVIENGCYGPSVLFLNFFKYLSDKNLTVLPNW